MSLFQSNVVVFFSNIFEVHILLITITIWRTFIPKFQTAVILLSEP